MAAVVPLAFSQNGEYFAYSSPDGTLKVWESTTGQVTQEYTPSSHLSATCSCICWGSISSINEVTPKKKKKRRSSVGDAVKKLDLIAVGTTSGALLLYSIVKGDLHTQLTDGHSDIVNDVCWNSNGDVLYSCSNDQHVVEWDVASASVKNKFKADKRGIYSVAVCHTQEHLLTAGRTIKLWNLHTKELLKTFTGHATEVFRLIPVRNLSIESDEQAGAVAKPSIEGAYFLSAALGDRLVNAWQINVGDKNKNSLASFSLSEEPVHLSLSKPQSSNQPHLLLSVTKGGQLHIFQHILNGKCKKPLKPRYTVQVVTSSKVRGEQVKPIPILSATIRDNSHILLTHGNFLKPTFEKLEISSLQAETVLERDDPSKSVIQTQEAVSKVKTPNVSNDVTVLAPGHMGPSSAAVTQNGQEKQGKKKRRKSIELTIEERLNAMGVDPSKAKGDKKTTKHPPKADTLATLLAQGLQSQDKKILGNVLQNNNEKIIRNTVKRLPLPIVVPLVKELSARMQGHSQSGSALIKWIRMVLTTHTSYLMTFPELVDTLSSLYQMMDSRVTLFDRLSRLQGKLDLMLSQITNQSQEEDEVSTMQQPMLVYQDDSSDEDFNMADMIPDNSESEENWEELSDMDVANGEAVDEEGDGENGIEDDSDSDSEEDME